MIGVFSKPNQNISRIIKNQKYGTGKVMSIQDKNQNRSIILKQAAIAIRDGKLENAKKLIQEEYPFVLKAVKKRQYSVAQKMEQFWYDGFIDRYSGERLINPGILKVLSNLLPDIFPYQPHWSMTSCHQAYWDVFPTIDHIEPIARGGDDNKGNWVTTSMRHNAIKSNWTLEQLDWKLHDRGDIKEWNGLTDLFVEIVEADESLQKDPYIKRWYDASLKVLK